jgi:hypothetical protein
MRLVVQKPKTRKEVKLADIKHGLESNTAKRSERHVRSFKRAINKSTHSNYLYMRPKN